MVIVSVRVDDQESVVAARVAVEPGVDEPCRRSGGAEEKSGEAVAPVSEQDRALLSEQQKQKRGFVLDRLVLPQDGCGVSWSYPQ